MKQMRGKRIIAVVSLVMFHPCFAFAEGEQTAFNQKSDLKRQAEIDCISSSFRASFRNVKGAIDAKMPEDVDARLKKTDRGITIDGYPATEVTTKDIGNDKGIYHTELYRVNHDGKIHFVKVIDDKDVSMSYRIKTGSIDLDDIYRGMLWAEEAGGPHFYRAGRMRKPDGSAPYFFEMEDLFSGQSTASYKGYLRGEQNFLAILKAHPKVIPSIAHLFVRAFELRLAPLGTWDYHEGSAANAPGAMIGGDLDFMISGDQAAWLDTDKWDVVSGKFDRRAMTGVYDVILRLGNDYGTQFKSALMEEIKKSVVLSNAAKKQLLTLASEPPVKPREVEFSTRVSTYPESLLLRKISAEGDPRKLTVLLHEANSRYSELGGDASMEAKIFGRKTQSR